MEKFLVKPNFVGKVFNFNGMDQRFNNAVEEDESAEFNEFAAIFV